MGRMSRRVVALLSALLLAAGCADGGGDGHAGSTDGTTGPSAPCQAGRPQLDVSYVEGGDRRQVLDLYLPDDAGCEPVPVVVWVHGGGWRTGDKSRAVDDKVDLWTDAGWAVASVNYRLTDPALPEADRVMAPAHNEDVAAAVGWLVGHGADLGIDPERIALAGHSAGAGIVAALATDPSYLDAMGLEPADLTCVAPLDTEAFDIAAAASTAALAGIYESAFGTDPRRWEDLSPLTHVGEAPLPDLFVVTRGMFERRRIVHEFASAAERAGGAVTVVDLPGYTHEDVNRQIGADGDVVLTPALQTFLRGCLAP